MARLFAGISAETLRRCDEIDEYWLAVLEARAAMEAAGVAAVLEASGL